VSLLLKVRLSVRLRVEGARSLSPGPFDCDIPSAGAAPVAQGWKLIFLGPRARTPAVMKTPHYFARTHVTLYVALVARRTYAIVTRGADVNARLLRTERRNSSAHSWTYTRFYNNEDVWRGSNFVAPEKILSAEFAMVH
jgi:hypothetical protein